MLQFGWSGLHARVPCVCPPFSVTSVHPALWLTALAIEEPTGRRWKDPRQGGWSIYSPRLYLKGPSWTACVLPPKVTAPYKPPSPHRFFHARLQQLFPSLTLVAGVVTCRGHHSSLWRHFIPWPHLACIPLLNPVKCLILSEPSISLWP